ncbi:MAG: hypothetical protein ACJ768_21535 [Gaiellaceae bacterium]
MAVPYVRPTRYAVNLLPDSIGFYAQLFEIIVECRGDDRWAVLRQGQCLGSDGAWAHELRPSEREDDWLDAHRFDLDTALRLAKEAAPQVTVKGRPAAEVLARLLATGRIAHRGGNAECCPACHGTNPRYPFICPGPDGEPPAGGAQKPKEADNPRTVCVCGHTRAEHLVVGGRLLCDECVPDSTENLTCEGFEAL